MCQRIGCWRPASVTLSFRYDARQASLVDLMLEKHPTHYDICTAHADVLTVPRGWERLDRRRQQPNPNGHAAPGPEPADDASSEQKANRSDRYAALRAELPRLAEACGTASEDAADEDDHPEPDRSEDAGDQPPGPPADPDHLLDPVTADAVPETPMMAGQLQMSLAQEPGGVVVALTRARHP